MLSKDRRRDAAAHPRVRRAGRHVHDVPGLRRHPAERGGALVDDRRASTSPTPARCRSATSPTGSHGRRAVGGAPLLAGLRRHARLVRRDRARLPVPRPPGGHAVGRRGAAHQDDPPPRLVAHRRHLRLRRADHRPAPARHPAHERAAAAAARQGQHRARRRAQARGRSQIADHVVDLGPGAGRRGRRDRVRGHRRGAAGQRHLTGRHLDDRARSRRRCARRRACSRCAARPQHNLQDVDVDIPLGVLVVVTGVAGSGKSSLIHGYVAGARRRRRRSTRRAIRGSRRSNPATYTGLLDPIRKAFAKANGVKPALFSANSEGACPDVQRGRRHLHRPGHDGRRSRPCARCARAGASRPRCSSTRSAARTSPRCSPCRSPRPRPSSPQASRTCPPRTRSSRGWSTSGSAT